MRVMEDNLKETMSNFDGHKEDPKSETHWPNFRWVKAESTENPNGDEWFQSMEDPKSETHWSIFRLVKS